MRTKSFNTHTYGTGWPARDQPVILRDKRQNASNVTQAIVCDAKATVLPSREDRSERVGICVGYAKRRPGRPPCQVQHMRLFLRAAFWPLALAVPLPCWPCAIFPRLKFCLETNDRMTSTAKAHHGGRGSASHAHLTTAPEEFCRRLLSWHRKYQTGRLSRDDERRSKNYSNTSGTNDFVIHFQNRVVPWVTLYSVLL